jgi:aminopeptidase-like protein
MSDESGQELASGGELYALVQELFPLCRSITGSGTRATLDIIDRLVPLRRTEVPTGRKVFDWEIPREWNIRDAYIKNAAGERVVDFRRHNLHVVNYSIPVRAVMSLAQLRPHLFSLPEHPDWIPYRTSYYSDSWGFCLPHRELQQLPAGDYEVCIDSTLAPGSLTMAEAVLPGESTDEVLVYTHICHPSLCNDNLSAVAVAALLARHLAGRQRALTYRFVFAPTTIGSIAWLAVNENDLSRIRHGLVLASLGDRGSFVYKRSRRGNAMVDRVVGHALADVSGASTEDFSPYGYDERQFCSPGFNLPVGRLSRTPNGRYPEYHTSADNLEFITADSLGDSLAMCARVCSMLESNRAYLNLSPKCEPRLGPRNLFRNVGGRGPSELEHAVLWVLNQSDGANDLVAIAGKSGIDYALIARAAAALAEANLLRPAAQGEHVQSIQ